MEQTDTSLGRIFGILLFLVAAAAFAWFFSDIVLYIVFAFILAMIGSPVVNLLNRVKIKGRGLPHILIAVVSLAFIFAVFFFLFYFVAPLIVDEIRSLLSIDPDIVSDGAAAWFTKAESFLKEHGLLDKRDDLGEIIFTRLKGLFGQFSITTLFGGTVNFVASLCVGIFSVIFITFFFLKDKIELLNKIRNVVPVSFRKSYDNIIIKTGPKLARYFGGVLLEMFIIGLIEGLACYFLGIPNPLLIGLLGGMFNVIPYLGPVIAAILGSIVAIAGSLTASLEAMQVVMLVVKVFVVFLTSNMIIDNFILQPLIYSKTVKAHPLEVFFAIMVGASLGGAVGMIFAVPVYSVFKVVLIELFAPYYTLKRGEKTRTDIMRFIQYSPHPMEGWERAHRRKHQEIVDKEKNTGNVQSL